jgi:multifunctional methyltransferase subunit TRM112
VTDAMVRLITHNLLACHAKGCTANNFPLQIRDAHLALRAAEFNPGFLCGFLPRIDWPALVGAARALGDASLPDAPPEMLDDDFLRALHHVLLEVRYRLSRRTASACAHAAPRRCTSTRARWFARTARMSTRSRAVSRTWCVRACSRFAGLVG